MAPANADRISGNFLGASPETRLVDEHEAAARLCLSVTTLRSWRSKKRGPAWSKIGAAVRYAPADLAAFIAAGRQTTNADEGHHHGS